MGPGDSAHTQRILETVGKPVSIMARILKHCRKPEGWLGTIVAWKMNRGHAELTAWGLGRVSPVTNATILDIGCGGGATVHRLAELAPTGFVHGIDYSATCVAVARRKNKALIATGRADVRQGEVSSLPYPAATFDLVTAIETHYFWPDLVGDLREVLRVLKPGGTLVIVGEAYLGGIYDERIVGWVDLTGMVCYSVAEVEDALASAGYSSIQISVDEERGWIRAVSRRPA